MRKDKVECWSRGLAEVLLAGEYHRGELHLRNETKLASAIDERLDFRDVERNRVASQGPALIGRHGELADDVCDLVGVCRFDDSVSGIGKYVQQKIVARLSTRRP